MNHSHSLEFKPSGAPYRCSGCKELGFGSSYRCEFNNCSYILHQECANAVSPAFHSFFKGSCFEFHERAPGYRTRICDACGKDVKGFVYHCSSTGFDLHPCCLNLKDSVSDEGGNVTLKLSQKVPSKCLKCNHRSVVNKVKGWSYVCSDNSSCYHVSCVKELILENWNRGYFSQGISSINYNRVVVSDGDQSQSHQIALPSLELRRSRRSRTMRNFSRMAVLVFKLIFSAIFGNPISAIAALLEALVSD
ncbi:hypothetical protein SESBI_00453 [Sesbania bispinosa]|nr:hypothetical protein SESBI_00453 [Sesbania bispinosa]